jgi:hypothetical protein
MKINDITATNPKGLAVILRESYRRSAGKSLTVALPGARFTVPAFLHVDRVDINGDTVAHRVNVGAVILQAVDFHVSEWGQGGHGALKELAGRFVDMVTHPNAPAVELVAIDWALELDALVNPAG